MEGRRWRGEGGGKKMEGSGEWDMVEGRMEKGEGGGDKVEGRRWRGKDAREKVEESWLKRKG